MKKNIIYFIKYIIYNNLILKIIIYHFLLEVFLWNLINEFTKTLLELSIF